MNKVLILLLAVVALGIGGWFFLNKQTTTMTKSGKPVVIGLSMATLQEERWTKEATIFKMEAEAKGAKVFTEDANNDAALQTTQVENLIDRGIDALVIVAVNKETIIPAVQKAKAANIPVVAYSRLIKQTDIDLFVGFDVIGIGKTLANTAVGAVPKGRYMIVNGAQSDVNSQFEQQGYYEVLNPYVKRGDIQVVYETWIDKWLPENAFAQAKTGLAKIGNKIDAALVSNDGMAGGVIKALQGAGLAGKVFVTGTDGELSAIQRIVAGTQTVTLLFPSERFARQAADAVVQLAQTKTTPSSVTATINNDYKQVPTVYIDTVLVTKQNVDETVIQSGFFKKEEVYR